MVFDSFFFVLFEVSTSVFLFSVRAEWETVRRVHHRPAIIRQIYVAQPPVQHGSQVSLHMILNRNAGTDTCCHQHHEIG
jgi:hypothetical protein